MNCKEIIREYLIEKGFDGLHHVGLTCCCFVHGDFMPCGDPHIKACEAGYIQSEKQDGQDIIEQTQYLPCPKCEKPRQVSGSGTGFLVCGHCGDDIPF